MKPVFHLVAGAPDPVAPFGDTVEADGWIFLTAVYASFFPAGRRP